MDLLRSIYSYLHVVYCAQKYPQQDYLRQFYCRDITGQSRTHIYNYVRVVNLRHE